MESSALLTSARRWWYLIVIGAVAAALAGAILSSSGDNRYEATADLLVGPVNAPVDTLRASSLLTQSYAEVATSTSFLRQVRDRANVSLTPTELQEEVFAAANDNTRILSIRVESSSPGRATLIANSVAAELIDVADEDEREEGQIRLLSEAIAPSSPLPRPVALMTILSMLAGGVIMAAVAALIDHLPWRRARLTPTSSPEIPWLRGRVIALTPRPSRRARAGGDRYRNVATRVLVAMMGSRPRSVAVVPTEAASGGVAAMVASVAVELARTSAATVVLDLSDGADLLDALAAMDDVTLSAGSETVGGHTVTRYRYGSTPFFALTTSGEVANDIAVADHLGRLDDEYAAFGASLVYCPSPTADLRTTAIVPAYGSCVVVGTDGPDGLDAVNESLGLLEAAGAPIGGVVIETAGPVDRSPLRRVAYRRFATGPATGQGPGGGGAASAPPPDLARSATNGAARPVPEQGSTPGGPPAGRR